MQSYLFILPLKASLFPHTLLTPHFHAPLQAAPSPFSVPAAQFQSSTPGSSPQLSHSRVTWSNTDPGAPLLSCSCHWDGAVKVSKGPPKTRAACLQCQGTAAAPGVSYPNPNPAGEQQQFYNTLLLPVSDSYSALWPFCLAPTLLMNSI